MRKRYFYVYWVICMAGGLLGAIFIPPPVTHAGAILIALLGWLILIRFLPNGMTGRDPLSEPSRRVQSKGD